MARLFAIALLLSAVAAGAWSWECAKFKSPGPAAVHGAAETVVLIAPGDSLGNISQKLERAGTVAHAILFALGVRLRAESARLKAGEYGIPTRASMEDIAAILMSGRSIEHKITAAEGLTSQMVFDIVKANPVLRGDAGPVPAEGTLLPETYLFTRGTKRFAIIAEMRNAQTRFVDREWAGRSPNLPFRTKQDAITLASIVEKETAIPEERRHIAAVFINRLRLGMNLASDPTVIYGISKGYSLGRGIRASELAAATPYNTYVMAGLPPTPICNPGKDTISAVLNPEVSDDLYFVADGTGGHVFSASIEEHEKNVARWRRIEGALSHGAKP